MGTAQQVRFRTRLYRHHAPLFLACVISVTGLYVTRPYKDAVSKLSFATAYPALVLLVFTLLIGPWNLLRRQRMPTSSDWRRDVGIWAGILGLLHAVIGQNVHLRGRPWLYYVYEHRLHGPTGLRHDLFGFNNFTGLVATFVLLALFATSNDWSLRRLGTPAWKRLQRWNYLCFALSAAHAIGYQAMEKQKVGFEIAAASCIGVTLLLQGAGYILRRREVAARVAA